MPDGEDLDCYCLGWDMPLKTTRGRVVAVVHRRDDDDDKLIVAAPGKSFDDGQIEKAILFQEKYFKHIIIIDEKYGNTR
jgi:inorganic pyrophosphatase